MGISDFFSDLYSSMGFPEAHADAPPKDDDDGSKEEGGDEDNGEGEGEEKEGGDDKEEGAGEEGDEGEEEGGEEEEEEEDEEPVDQKARLEEGEQQQDCIRLLHGLQLTVLDSLQSVLDHRSALATNITMMSASSA